MTPKAVFLWCPLLLLLFAPGGFGAQESRPAGPTLFVVTSETGFGIPIGPPPYLPSDDVLELIEESARSLHLKLGMTVYPELADCLLHLELNEVRSGAPKSWILIDGASGVILDRGHSSSLRIAIHDAVKAIARPRSEETSCRPPG